MRKTIKEKYYIGNYLSKQYDDSTTYISSGSNLSNNTQYGSYEYPYDVYNENFDINNITNNNLIFQYGTYENLQLTGKNINFNYGIIDNFSFENCNSFNILTIINSLSLIDTNIEIIELNDKIITFNIASTSNTQTLYIKDINNSTINFYIQEVQLISNIIIDSVNNSILNFYISVVDTAEPIIINSINININHINESEINLLDSNFNDSIISLNANSINSVVIFDNFKINDNTIFNISGNFQNKNLSQNIIRLKNITKDCTEKRGSINIINSYFENLHDDSTPLFADEGLGFNIFNSIISLKNTESIFFTSTIENAFFFYNTVTNFGGEASNYLGTLTQTSDFY